MPQVAILIRISKFGVDLALWGFLIFGIYCIIYVAICLEMVARVAVKAFQALPWYLEYVAARVSQEALIQLTGLAADATASVAQELGLSVEPPLSIVPAAVAGPPRPTHSPSLLPWLFAALGVVFGRFGGGTH